MMTDEMKRELAKKLDPQHVKERTQSGRPLSYIEGWYAIAEANRIFGFDNWTRETIEMRCVAENQRRVGSGDRAGPGWGVSYLAKVRVTAMGIVREGFGSGHGVDRDLGLAHESALKEAETDAMKRALMTFGNPFGLALYDKSKANVGVNEEDHTVTEEAAPVETFVQEGEAASSYAMKKYVPEMWDQYLKQLQKEDTASGLALIRTNWRKEIGKWPVSWRNTANAEFEKRKEQILAGYRNEEAAEETVVWDEPQQAAE